MKPTSFDGYYVYRIDVVMEGEYIKPKSKLFKSSKKPNKKIEMYRTITKYIVSSNEERALEKYKNRYIYPAIGDKVEMQNRSYSYEYLRSEVTSVFHEIRHENNRGINFLKENLTAEDYVQYMVFLKKGFDEIVGVDFHSEEEREEK